MSGIKLREYQKRSVVEIREALAKYKRVLFQAQTAFGKTITFSYIALSSQKYNRKVLIFTMSLTGNRLFYLKKKSYDNK
jgi:superfamily II DNA or RNA helicase